MEPGKSQPSQEMSQPPPYVSPPASAPYVAPQPVIVTGAVVGVVHTGNLMSPKPTPYTCPSCRAQIVTRTENRSTTRTHLMALAMFVTGLWCCCCLPYCMDSCQNVDHYCPSCSAYIGSNRA